MSQTPLDDVAPKSASEKLTGMVKHGVDLLLGTGGDTTRDGEMTRATGCPIATMKNSMTAGPRGPVLLQDIDLIEKIQHFDREKTPPRNVHALGNGAYGNLTITNDISRYSMAKVFTMGKKTNIFTRFSGVFTELGEADTTRDLRGFAVKFYTEDGNWDLLGINTPVFNVRDAKVGPDAIHAFKRDPRTFEWNEETLWDFCCTHPEAFHQTLMIHTDRVGTPKSYRFMHGYGCNTFSLLNDKKERFWVKFHILSNYNATGLTDAEAKVLAGEDPDWLKRDLREAIERGDYPTWRFAMQVMSEDLGYKYPWTFDCTKVWPHDEFPLIDIGTIQLDRNPVNYFAEVEQVAFSPANVVPGIGFSPDKLLQGRLLIYSDTQFHRLGPNYLQIPINCPLAAKAVRTNYIGGAHNHEYESKFPHYYPSFLGGPTPTPQLQEPPQQSSATQCYFYDYYYEGEDKDYYEQPRNLFKLQLTLQEQECTVYNIATSLAYVMNEGIVENTLMHLSKIDMGLGQRVKERRMRLMQNKTEKSQGSMLWEQLHKEVMRNVDLPAKTARV